jgi:hypothetical protein
MGAGGRVEPQITETADTESVDTGAHLYIYIYIVLFFLGTQGHAYP